MLETKEKASETTDRSDGGRQLNGKERVELGDSTHLLGIAQLVRGFLLLPLLGQLKRFLNGHLAVAHLACGPWGSGSGEGKRR